MRAIKAILAASGSVCLLLAALLGPTPASEVQAQAKAAELFVVVASSMSVTEISSGTLRRVFTGYPTEAGGRRLIPVNHTPNSDARVRFDQIVLGLSPQEVGRYWIDRRIRDEGSAPKTVPSPEMAMRLAASLPGVITYVTSDLLNAKVRALTIDGKTAQQPTYMLR